MSLTERLTATLRPLLSRRSLRIYLAPSMVVAAALEGDRIAGVAALPVANPAGHWEAPLAALRALLRHPAGTLAEAAAETRDETLAGASAGTSAGTSAGSPASPGPQPGKAGAIATAAAGTAPAIPAVTGAAASRNGDMAAGADLVLAALTAQAPLSVSLSGRWCQAVMVPWSDALLAEPAATRFLHMQLSAIYGDAARHWSIANDEAPYGEPRAACGIDAVLLQALRSDLGKRCTTIEPVLGTAARMPAAVPAFAIVEPGKLTMATTAHGHIAAICSQPCGAAWPAELERAWQRWTLRMPELDGIGAVAVIDLSGQAPALATMPALFQPVDTPFGPAHALPQATLREVSCA